MFCPGQGVDYEQDPRRGPDIRSMQSIAASRESNALIQTRCPGSGILKTPLAAVMMWPLYCCISSRRSAASFPIPLPMPFNTETGPLRFGLAWPRTRFITSSGVPTRHREYRNVAICRTLNHPFKPCSEPIKWQINGNYPYYPATESKYLEWAQPRNPATTHMRRGPDGYAHD